MLVIKEPGMNGRMDGTLPFHSFICSIINAHGLAIDMSGGDKWPGEARVDRNSNVASWYVAGVRLNAWELEISQIQ